MEYGLNRDLTTYGSKGIGNTETWRCWCNEMAEELCNTVQNAMEFIFQYIYRMVQHDLEQFNQTTSLTITSPVCLSFQPHLLALGSRPFWTLHKEPYVVCCGSPRSEHVCELHCLVELPLLTSHKELEGRR